jgi:hypothetical protein
MAPHLESGFGRPRRKPSRLAQQLDDAFAPCSEWSEVRVVRDSLGRKDRVVAELRPPTDPHSFYNWAEAA